MDDNVLANKVPFSMGSLFIRLKVFSPSCGLLFSLGEKAHSWVRNGYNLAFASLAASGSSLENSFGAGYMTAKACDAVIRHSAGYSARYAGNTLPSSTGICTSRTDENAGIVIGTGDAVWSMDQYELDAPVEAGTGAGQMRFLAMAAPVMSYASKIWTASHSRIFTNLSGDTISLKEVGLKTYSYGFYSNDIFLVARDVLSVSVDVPHLSSLEAVYDISGDFSAID